MANLPSQHPHLGLHLADRSLTPLVSSSRTRPQLDALTSLTHAALGVHESALRLGLGAPQRVMVEHAAAGPVLLQSYMRAGAGAGAGVESAAPTSSFAAAAATTTATTATNNSNNNNGTTPNNNLTSSTAPPSSAATSTSQPPTAATTNGISPNRTSSTPSPPPPSASASQPPADEASAVERRLQQLRFETGPGTSPSPEDDEEEGEEGGAPAPMLVGVVVAPGPDDARDARRAAARLERVGREVQARWAEARPRQVQHGRQGNGEGRTSAGAAASAGAAGGAGD
ncbi:hypothetical protein GGR52DRAFT_588933 [Hypoxylon sp. FL1284]|nr:hypothetical protein GGR52DRAFT_588933 [Hypoxylon sp. FL1284]